MGHKVIGLVSGGKDSCFNLLHTVANGHEIIALATLTPAPGIAELDSHLYQSVGTHVPPLIAQALGVPHFTGVIKGKAVQTGSEYGARTELSGVTGDETEDLTELLRKVLVAHPNATALASGAILSTYQRQRIEHVCSRLGLTSIAYLWQAKQLPLVDQMISCGLEAVLVKVAGVGLSERHVGKRLSELRGLLARLEAEYGAHPAGEGGEYETLTLDTPLFSHRIELVNTKVVITDPEPYTVAYLQIGEARLVEKEGWIKPNVEELREMLGLNEEGVDVGLGEEGREVLEDVGECKVQEFVPSNLSRVEEKKGNGSGPRVRFGKRGGWFAASVDGEGAEEEGGVAAELSYCFDKVEEILRHNHLSLTQVAHITLLLSTMSLFPTANSAYMKRFGTSPPSRATVAVPFQDGQNVRLEVVGFSGEAEVRSALHVQGLSYWAPANIGPYSQAVRVNERVHIAGQIPLIPATMTLPPTPQPPTSPYQLQASLALQHVSRVIGLLRSPHSTGGGWTGWGESCVAWWAVESGKGGGEGVDVVRKAWKVWSQRNEFRQAPVAFVQASELPRGALVEYQTNLHTGRRAAIDSTLAQPTDVTQSINDEETNESVDEPRAMYTSGREVDGTKWEAYECLGNGAYREMVFIPRDVAEKNLGHWVGKERAVTVRAYHDPTVTRSKIKTLLQEDCCYTAIPVLSICDRDGITYSVALEVFGV